MKEKGAVPALIQLMLDPKVDRTIKAEAVRAVGRIDAAANKAILLRALTILPDYPPVGLYAAEALAKFKDQQTVETLRKYSAQVHNPYLMYKTQQAIRKLEKPKKQ
ncbi:MAG: HEAT repeat domain-containing protein [Pyrinomonadaceae bacterium]